MYSLTIHFGPNAMTWAFLFKEKEKAVSIFELLSDLDPAASMTFEDDFGQLGHMDQCEIRGLLLEDLDLIERASSSRDERTYASGETGENVAITAPRQA